MSTTPSLPRLTTDQIKYLALEGGGGKGTAYAGALAALFEIGLLKCTQAKQVGVKGISGASAGAITALMLSCGFDADEIKSVMEIERFDTFFEIPRPHYVPTVTGFAQREPKRPVRSSSSPEQFQAVTDFVKAILQSLAVPLSPKLVWTVLNSAIEGVGKFLGYQNVGVLLGLLGIFWSDLPPAAKGALGGGVDKIAESLVDDLGVFVGEAPWRFLNKWSMLGAARITEPQRLTQIPGWDAANDTQDPVAIKKKHIERLSAQWNSSRVCCRFG
jgi:NTE family protein